MQRDDGKTATVDLGPQDQTAPLKIKRGTRLRVLGRIGRANNRPLLLATAVVANGKAQRIRRPAWVPLKKVSGQIEALRSIRLRGATEPQIVAEVVDEQGNRRLVVLGQQDQLAALKLKRGRRISLLARPVQTRSRRLWLAESVVVDGHEVQRRPTMPVQKAAPKPSSDKPGTKNPPAASKPQQKEPASQDSPNRKTPQGTEQEGATDKK